MFARGRQGLMEPKIGRSLMAMVAQHEIIHMMIRPFNWLMVAALVTVIAFAQPKAVWADDARPPLSPLAARLSQVQAAQSTPETVFGVPSSEADRIFAPVAPWQPLPDWFVPPDLVRLGGVPRVLGQPVSAVLIPDLESMIAEAQADGVDLVVLSAYRSFSEQEVIFERNVERSMYRPEGVLSRADAESAAGRFSARAGHSQHQLGLAIDFTTAQMNYGLGARFAETDTGRWLIEKSWKFGFVFPYTEAAEPRSGYRYEPWHVRWVGRQLAQVMHSDGYLVADFPIPDDYILAVRELMACSNNAPCASGLKSLPNLYRLMHPLIPLTR
jgi:LAS superfamily LD-carboxypeptidase LdcB